MDDFSSLSQYREVMSEMVRKKVVAQYKTKNGLGSFSFGYFSLAEQRKVTRRQWRNSL